MQSNQPHTFVVVTLDPPIRKGQTLYPHIVLQVICQFHCISMGSYQKKKMYLYGFPVIAMFLSYDYLHSCTV